MTKIRNSMHRHLYLLQKPCPACQEVTVDLTDAIKDCIMTNRVYHIPKPKKEPKIINNNNIINNYIMNTDFIEKMKHYAKHKNITLCSFDDKIGDAFSNNAKRLENNDFTHFELDHDDMMSTINISSSVDTSSDLGDFNIYHDKKTNKIFIHEGTWDEMEPFDGIKRIIQNIQSYYWNQYELFLLRNIIKNGESIMSIQCIELLSKYYEFILCYDLPPCCLGLNKNEILYNSEDEMYHRVCNNTDTSQRFERLYNRLKTNQKKSETNAIRNKVLSIITDNSKKNIARLNSSITELFSMDETFKRDISTTR
jgi:hypothetical protein